MLGQSKIYLQHQRKPSRHKKISVNRDYTFQTSDSTYYRHRILSFTDSTLRIGANFPGDTALIYMTDIQSLRKNKKSGVFEVIAFTGLILLSVTPVVWAFEGGTAAIETLKGVGVLAAFSVPIILLKEIGRNKDTKNKWNILTE
jgi:hypothetical protein